MGFGLCPKSNMLRVKSLVNLTVFCTTMAIDFDGNKKICGIDWRSLSLSPLAYFFLSLLASFSLSLPLASSFSLPLLASFSPFPYFHHVNFVIIVGSTSEK